MSFIFSICFLLWSLETFAVALPSHFGSEFKVRGISPTIKDFSEIDKIFKDEWSIELDITSTKLLKGKVHLVTHGTLSRQKSTVGASLFYKLSKNLYIGGTSSFGQGLDYDQDLIVLFSFDAGKYFIEPFFSYRIKNHKAGAGGLRVFYKKRLEVTLGAEKVLVPSETESLVQGINIFVILGVPLKINFSEISEFLFSTDKDATAPQVTIQPESGN